MSRRRSVLSVPDQEREHLRQILRRGTHAARTLTRAHVLLLSATGDHTVAQIATLLNIAPATVYNVRARYRTAGFEGALTDQPRPGFPRRVTPDAEAHITTIACTTPPTGRARWTVQLVTDELIELYGTHLSRESVRRVLKKVSSNRGSNANGASDR